MGTIEVRFIKGRKMMNISPQLFKDAFIAAFKLNRKFIKKWDDGRERTSYMTSRIYPTIADYLDLDLQYEYKNGYKKIDAVLLEDDSTIRVAIEHENIGNNAHEEIQQLSQANYELNVLVTYIWEPESLRERFGEILKQKRSSGTFLIILRSGGDGFQLYKELKWKYYIYKPESSEFEEFKCPIDCQKHV